MEVFAVKRHSGDIINDRIGLSNIFCKVQGDFMFEDMKKRLEQSIKVIVDDLAMVRTGRATTSLVETISVEAYPGTWMKMPEIASINVLDAHMLIIKPWDHSTAKKIESAIQGANIGLSPVIDGEMIRISIPSLSEDDIKRWLEEMQKLFDQYVERVEELGEQKEKELMQI